MTKKDIRAAHFADGGNGERLPVDDKQKNARLPLFDNPLDSFRNGAVFDGRLKLAIDILTHNPDIGDDGEEGESMARNTARYALDVATELFALAEERGLIRRLDDKECANQLVGHMKRQAEFIVEQNKATARAQERGIQVGKAVAGAYNRAN